jgi:hypothetical protein
MKKILFKISAVAAIVLLGNACGKDFLDREPLGIQTDQNFFNDPGNATLAVNAVYDAVSWDEYGSPFGYVPHNYEFMFGDILSDDAAKGSEPTDFVALTEMEEWRAPANLGPSGAVWTNVFIGVFRANTCLQNLPDAKIDEELKNRLMGEAHFLRAYIYFYGARLFGGMPLFSEPVLPDQIADVKREDLAATYQFIINDLKEAERLLPRKSEYDQADLGRATRGAASAYLGRVQAMEVGLGLNGRTWQDVYDACGTVINSGEYSLMENYAQIFEDEGENGSESIFEIQFKTSNEGWGSIKTGSTSTIFQNNRSWWGWGFNNPTQNLVDEFEPGDPRRACTAYGNNDVVYGVLQVVDYPSQNQTGFLNRKAAQPIPDGNNKAGGQNQRKMRYADVLLMRAEAAFHLNNEAEARTLVNTIRARARKASKPKGSIENDAISYPAYPAGTNDNVLPDVTASGPALLDAIYHERRTELAMECIRYWDLIRTGRYINSLDAAFRANCTAKSITSGLANPMPVMPIPLTEVQSWGLTQNAGY